MSDPEGGANREIDYSRALLWAVVIVFLSSVVRFAWISDDAFISFRALANWISGHGLVSNPGERVQAFTNPLWVLCLAIPYWLSGNVYWSAILTSFAASTALAVLVARHHRERPHLGILAFALLIACTSFVAYSTSGLENTLAHLLLAAFVLQEIRGEPKHPVLPWLIAGLIMLNRMDQILLVLPALVVRMRRQGFRASLKPFALGFAPWFAWVFFAIVYYGFPFPNTAYAKLNSAILKREIWFQGFSYLADAALRDGILVAVIGIALLFGIRERKRVPNAVPLLVGLVVYAGYVVFIGGDFMGGRFFTASYLIAALVLVASLSDAPRRVVFVLAALVAFFGRDALAPLPVEPKTECAVPPSGIVDERACYVEHTGIAQNLRKRRYENHPYFAEGLKWRTAGEEVVESQLVGLAGYGAGPNVHIVDEHGLTDALMARIQYKPAETGAWRIGHFRRSPPAGYLETVKSGVNQVENACLHALYDDLRLATRSRLFAPGRWGAIWRLNFVRGGCKAP